MHAMTDHTTVEEVFNQVINWEDADSWVIIGKEENGALSATQYWQMNFQSGNTLLEALHKIYTKCYCDEDEYGVAS